MRHVHGDRSAAGRPLPDLPTAVTSAPANRQNRQVKRGIIITSGDPRTVAERAAEAEAAGWDGVFTYDAIAVGDDLLYDPWVTLAAMAML